MFALPAIVVRVSVIVFTFLIAYTSATYRLSFTSHVIEQGWKKEPVVRLPSTIRLVVPVK